MTGTRPVSAEAMKFLDERNVHPEHRWIAGLLDAYAEQRAAVARREALHLAHYIAIHACFPPPDGGSPSEDEREMCAEVARQIYAVLDQEKSNPLA